jgi:hypothetical protein
VGPDLEEPAVQDSDGDVYMDGDIETGRPVSQAGKENGGRTGRARGRSIAKATDSDPLDPKPGQTEPDEAKDEDLVYKQLRAEVSRAEDSEVNEMEASEPQPKARKARRGKRGRPKRRCYGFISPANEILDSYSPEPSALQSSDCRYTIKACLVKKPETSDNELAQPRSRILLGSVKRQLMKPYSHSFRTSLRMRSLTKLALTTYTKPMAS